MTMHRLLPIILACVLALMACSVSREGRHSSVSALSAAHTDYSHATSTEYDYFFLAAAREQNNGDFAGAFDLLRHCTRLDTLAPEAYYLLGVYYSDLGYDSLAAVSLQRAITLNPKNDAYHERLAQWYLQTQEYGKAIDAYEYLYANNKSRTDVLEILLKLYQQEKDYPQMLATIDRYEQVEGLAEETTLTKMQVYQLMGDKSSAYNALVALCSEHPNDVNYKVLLGNWLQQNGRSAEARQTLCAAEATDPNNEYVALSLYDLYRAEGDDSLAQIYRDRILLNKHTATTTKTTILQHIIHESEQNDGDSCEVLALFDDILRLDSTNADIAEMKSSYMFLKEMPRDSINNVLRYILAIAPDRVTPRLQLLQTAMQQQDMQGIIDLCEPALIYNPQEVAFCYYLGLAHYQKGDTLAALDAFRKGISRINSRSDAEMVSDFYGLVGDIEHLIGNKLAAYAAYDSCLHWKADNVSCLNNYAYFLCLDTTNLKKAETMSLKAINLEPNNPTYLDTHAWVLFMQERYAEAKIFIDSALANSDSLDLDSTIYDHAGDIYEACDDKPQAVAYWREALLYAPDDEATIKKKIHKYEK